VKRRRQVAFIPAWVLAALLAAILAVQPAAAAPGADPPPPPPPPAPVPIVPDGVSISGIVVAGLTADAAAAVVQTAFESPLTLRVAKSVLMPSALDLGATAYIPPAVVKALVAPPNTDVPLTVRVAGAKVRSYVAVLAKRFDRSAVDSHLLLRKVTPFVTKSKPGRAVQRSQATAAIVRALAHNDRLPMQLPTKTIAPAVTRANIGPVVVIRRESKSLNLYEGMRPVRSFRIATGMAQYPTPLGRFQVVTKWKNPWWYPPNSDWAMGKEPIPPGPGNPLGTRWMGLSAPGVGIHGTPDAASLGYSLSHGCIRMAISEAEWLFNRVDIGTTVFIVAR
jgi:lipoprotein-anchoring transpeptidase ErfK/SrfK